MSGNMSGNRRIEELVNSFPKKNVHRVNIPLQIDTINELYKIKHAGGIANRVEQAVRTIKDLKTFVDIHRSQVMLESGFNNPFTEKLLANMLISKIDELYGRPK